MKSNVLVAIIVAAALVLGGVFFLLRFQMESGANPVPTTTVQPPAPPVDLAALKASAGQGDPRAQTRLARLYLEGSVVKMNVKEALKWLQQATNQNYPDALAAWGELTQAGQGVPRNLPEAARLYRVAAEKGSVTGQYDLAYLYEQGTGVAKDEHEAAKWYQLAAEGGDPFAQYDIGQRYELGIGVAANRVAAFKWLTLAASQGQPDSAKLLPDLKRQMSGEELSQAGKLVNHFTPRPVP